ncbi:hypothetical protein CFP56_016238 [Quercus suber]|uniref:Uncharacterized protein n=1 Tax=Quercus suber TaxID=58331 RepID=A0AAW0KR03_QUESU
MEKIFKQLKILEASVSINAAAVFSKLALTQWSDWKQILLQSRAVSLDVSGAIYLVCSINSEAISSIKTEVHQNGSPVPQEMPQINDCDY